MRILHISDLHTSESRAENQERVIRALLDDITSLHATTAVDIVVFTGDLSAAGKPEEFRLGQEILLTPVLEALCLSPEALFLVPGNHDVNRDRIDRYLEAGLSATLTDHDSVAALQQSPDDLQRAAERLHDWLAFKAAYQPLADSSEIVPLAQAELRKIGGIDLGVVCLNSAWRASGGKADHGALLIGERQVLRAADAVQDAAIRLVAVHHPLDWLCEWDAESARAEFERVPTIVLSGHNHKAFPTSEVSPRGEAIYSRASCLYESSRYLNGYTVIDFDPDARRLVARLRTWWPERRSFDAATNVASGGELTLQFPSRPSGLPALRVSYADVRRRLEEDVRASTLLTDHLPVGTPRALDDILVAPRFFPLPYREALLTAEFTGDRSDLSHASPASALDSEDVIVVSGERESGVSMALYWLLFQALETDKDRLPAYVAFIPAFRGSRLENQLRAVATAYGLPADEPLPPMTIALDDVKSHSTGYLDALARYIRDNPQHRYMLGCHDDDQEALVRTLRSREIDVHRLFLGPFARRQLRLIVESNVGQEQAADVVTRVTRIISRNQLPRSPFIMTALATIVLRQPDITAINESGLLDAYATLLLESEHVGQPDALGMDPRRREHLLASFARTLVDRTADAIPRFEADEAEETIAAYFRERGRIESVSPGHVLDNLIARRVLAERDGLVGFRHPAFQEMFAGKWMDEDPAFVDYIFLNPIENRRIVGHAAGLRRSDKSLLTRVDDATAEALNPLDEPTLVRTFVSINDRPGWSDEITEIDDLKKRLQIMPPAPTPGDFDDELDRMDDRLEVIRERERIDPPEPTLITEVSVALELLSSVIRSSELVDDVPLKAEVLKKAIHGWATLAVLFAVREDQDRVVAARLTEVLEGFEIDQEVIDRIERLSDLLVIILTLVFAHSSLGSAHLEAVTQQVMQDEEFMANPVYALVTTFLYTRMRFPDWPVALAHLDREHGSHPVVRETVKAWALVVYRTERNLRWLERTRLEALLADIYAPEVPTVGQDGVQARAAQRSEVIKELRQSREDALSELADMEDTALDILDADPIEIEEGEPEESQSD